MSEKKKNKETKVIKKKSGTNNVLPPDVKNVYVHNKSVVVELFNGHKGVSTVAENDVFDPFVGFCISYFKAKNKGSFDLKKALDNCVENAKKKGYDQAILKGNCNINDFITVLEFQKDKEFDYLGSKYKVISPAIARKM